MPRATRYLENGYLYHLTHRCHDKQFFLRFSKELDTYREWLRVGAVRHRVPVLGFAITRNHVHVVAEVSDRDAVAAMMALAAGATAQAYHHRKGGEGSVWEHPYQCTRVEDGKHLLNCLRYVDLNMVRAGVVSHPREWRWCGYDESTGTRKRYRIIDRARLLHCTGMATMHEFSDFYTQSISERIELRRHAREAWWTEAVAVGGASFVEIAERSCGYRQSMMSYQPAPAEDPGTWAVREAQEPYGLDFQ